MSHEGINGVLSGRVDDLKEYELKLRHELVKQATSNGSAATDEIAKEAPKQTFEYLDIKYCHLRPDIPMKEQLFDSLNVKVTREVVSLFDFSAPPLNQGKKNKRCRQRRRQKRKEKKQSEKDNNIAVGELGDKDVMDEEATEKQKPDVKPAEIICYSEGTPKSNTNEIAEATAPHVEVGSAFTIHDWEKYTPAEHLSPSEWNDKLLSLSQEASKPQQEAEAQLPQDAILLDARNIYETRVGHFAVPNLPTFFPNTRKFSSLPMALNTPEAAEALAGKKVFMYCTGEIHFSSCMV